jgi:uncharacterized protein
MIESSFIEHIATEVAVRPEQVAAAVALFDKGATVPFVARYRKDVTGNLDEVKLEKIERRNLYYIALTNRRNAILDNVEKQGQLTPELREKIAACTDQVTLEDLYLPFKKQRRTKASVARDKGLESLGDFLWNQVLGEASVESVVATYVSPEKGVLTPEEALEGASHILAERVSLDINARATLRQHMLDVGKIATAPTKVAEGQKTKFEGYYEFSEPIKTIPSHRLLAVLRGVRLAILRMDLILDDDAFVETLAARYVRVPGSTFEPIIRAAVEDAYKRLLRPSIENEVITLAHEAADEEAIHVFRENARNVLLAPPAGNLPVLGVDPGLRTGCKLAVIDRHGVFLETATIFLTEPDKDEAAAARILTDLVQRHGIDAIAVGNGTGGREAARFINGLLRSFGRPDAFVVFVNEAGASVYSASKIARDEFPDLDVTIRGAISIARRLQDPLAELVKLEPRSIGVGQYQHDVNQRKLREGLYRTVESSVNLVGVDVNTASVELLRYVSGIQMGTAQNLVEFRSKNNGVKSRTQLMEVSGIGEKSFEQCAGFLRIRNSEHPLDATGIHPEAYPLVEQIAASLALPVADLIGNKEALDKIDFAQFANDTIGRYTLRDIRDELLKPGRDPRAEFRAPKFIEGVEKVGDLEIGMEMEGVVTNVTDFGAFIDIGVHQDGLVHLSELTNRFVRDPREIVKVGDIVRAKVIKVEPEVNRISLSMKALLPPPAPRRRPAEGQGQAQGQQADPNAAPRAQRPPRRDTPQGAQDGPPRQRRPEGAPAGGGDRPQQARRPQGERPPQGDRQPQGDRAQGGRPQQPREERRPSQPRRDDRRPDARPDTRKYASRDAAPAKPKEPADNMNTALAEQLALLKQKFNG